MTSPSDAPASKNEPVDDPCGRAISEVARALGIMVGLGALPLLRDRFPEYFWIAGLAGGALSLAAGRFHAVLLRRRAPDGSTSSLAAPDYSFAVQTGLIGMCLLLPALLAFGLQALGGFLLWIYLGLAVGTHSFAPMFWPRRWPGPSCFTPSGWWSFLPDFQVERWPWGIFPSSW